MAYGTGTNAPYGLKPSKHLSGDCWNGQVTAYPIASGYAANIFTGDPVILNTDGTITTGTAVADNPIVGVFMGCFYISAAGVPTPSPYWPTGTVTQGTANAVAFVVDDPTVIFDVQVSNSQNVAPSTATVSVLQTQFYNNANIGIAGGGGAGITNPAAGSTASGISAVYLDNNSFANANPTRTFKILGLVPVIGNSVSALYNSALILVNNHYYKGGTGTAGV